jgi:hypothetical protein
MKSEPRETPKGWAVDLGTIYAYRDSDTGALAFHAEALGPMHSAGDLLVRLGEVLTALERRTVEKPYPKP